MSEEEALANFCLVDKDGLLAEDSNRTFFMEQKKVNTVCLESHAMLELKFQNCEIPPT